MQTIQFRFELMNGELVMCRASTSGICLLLLITTAGCGKKDGPIHISMGVKKPPDQAKIAQIQSLVDDYVDAMNRSSDKLEKVVDENSAVTAAEELTKKAKRFREMAEELKSVDEITKAERAQLSYEKLQPALANSSKANQAVLEKMKQGAIPPKAIKALQEAYLDSGKAGTELSEAFRAKGI